MAQSARDLQTRTHPLLMAVVLFLGSELMFFAGMLMAYYNLRSITPVWPPAGIHLDLTESAIGTGVLALSSFAMFAATELLHHKRTFAARVALGTTIVLGIAFLAIAVHGWSTNAFRIDTHAYGSVFYMLTGFHALHVLVGVILMGGWFLAIETPAVQQEDRSGAESVALYWHFVFAVWILIWGTIYFIR
jgi:cytochrome c oxidase subunit 3